MTPSKNGRPTVAQGTEGRQAQFVFIEPDMARWALEGNSNNRNLSWDRVEKYIAELKGGRFVSNGETVKFAGLFGESDLLDGQHRLTAIAESGIGCELLIVENLPVEVMSTIDTGRARSFADLAKFSGRANVNKLAATTRWLHWYLTTDRSVQFESYKAVPHTVLMDFLLDLPDDLDARINDVHRHRSVKKWVAPGPLVGIYTLAVRRAPGQAGEFLGLLETGLGMDDKHPVYQLRELLRNNAEAVRKRPLGEVTAFVAKAWVQFVTGKRTAHLRYRPEQGEAFPDILRGSYAGRA